MAKRRRLRRFVIASLVLVLVLVLLGVGSIAGIFYYHGRDLEAIDETALREYRPSQVTRVLARDGTVIGEIYTQRRTVIAYEKFPHHVEDAFLAAEDADFYHHEGMDYFGMVRALFANVRAGKIRQGASTITQQVVKNFLLSPERTFERKVQELILARRLEQVLDKREILTLYLNEIYLGEGRYGIDEASRYYFGKGVSEINLGQAALLATLPKAPSTGSPFKSPDKAKQRQIYVLEQMSKHGFATPQDAKRYIDAPLELADRSSAAARERPAVGAQEFVDVARAKLVEVYGEDAIDTLGATVTTTVDLEVQHEARAGLMNSLIAIDERRHYGHGIKPAKSKNLDRAMARGQGPLEVGRIYPVIIEAREKGATDEAGFPGKVGEHPVYVRVPPGSRYDEPEKTMVEQFPAGGITMVRIAALSGADPNVPAGRAVAEIASGPEGTMVLASVETGEVLAMVGGSSYGRGDFNRAIAAKRQPGSSFKPIVYGAAIAGKELTAASLISDSPEVYQKWRPTNFERDVYRGDIRMRVALTHSVNTVAIKLLDNVGFDRVHAFAREAGIESKLNRNNSLALGTSEVVPVELMTAYLTFARGGSRIEPIIVKKIEVPGLEDRRAKPVSEQTIEPEVAFVLTSLMRSVVEDGTGKRAKALGRPVAGKTGTSDDSKDAWFAGYTPRHVAVAWVGFDVPKKMSGESGGKAAIPVWLAGMKAAEAGSEPLEFVPPPGVAIRSIDKATGLLAPTAMLGPDGMMVTPDPETMLEEYFVPGTEPIETAEPSTTGGDDVLLDLYGDEEPAADPEPTEATPIDESLHSVDGPDLEPSDAAPSEPPDPAEGVPTPAPVSPGGADLPDVDPG